MIRRTLLCGWLIKENRCALDPAGLRVASCYSAHRGGLPVAVVRGCDRTETSPCVLPSPHVHRVGTPNFHFSKLSTLLMPLLRFDDRLATTAAMLVSAVVLQYTCLKSFEGVTLCGRSRF